MSKHQAAFDWIEHQEGSMLDLVKCWADINTHTLNLQGLESLTHEIAESFSVFNETVRSVPLDSYQAVNLQGNVEPTRLAPALSIRKRPDAPKQVLLVCHMDTVFLPGDSFQKTTQIKENQLKGPGVTDAKGGIVVILKALEALEQSPYGRHLGWHVFLNTDEEMGSPGSAQMLEEMAKEYQIGFVFEPCLPNGDLVGARKGSGNFTLVARGRSAHAGRDHALGRNAINALAKCVIAITDLTHKKPGLTVNFGFVSGGTQVNVVPHLAVAKFNIRVQKNEDMKFAEDEIKKMIQKIEKETEVKIELHGGFSAPPKTLAGKTQNLHEYVRRTAEELGLNIGLQATGGVCDGNRLNAAGLPTVDTMGPSGDHIHHSNEYLNISSLTERTRLTTLCLLKWASGEWQLEN
jgi:glutamate carboxypeptidase